MNTFLRNYLFRSEAVVITLPVLIIIFWPNLTSNFLTSTYMPHGSCYLWMPELVLLHVSSDMLIGLAYIFISVSLGFLVYRASGDIPFHRMFLAFGLFIISCGFTHIMSVLNVYEALYWLSGSVKIVTAVASVLTAVALPLFIPKTLELIRSAKLSDERKAQIEKANKELEKLNKKLLEMDTLKTEFFTNVSHELRTPLALILGPVERLLSSDILPGSYLNELKVVQSNAKMLLKHVNDLLDISKLEVGKLELRYENFNISNLIRITASYFESLGNENNISLNFNIPDALVIQADPEKLERIFVNLFSNAYKYTPRNGKIECTLYRDGDHVNFIIKDSGQGIDPQKSDVLFNRYAAGGKGLNRRLGSTGLGLSIIKEFIELHGGIVSAKNSEEGGAQFMFTIPVTAAEGIVINESTILSDSGYNHLNIVSEMGAEEITENPATENPDEKKKNNAPNILVVEDNYEMNKFISGTLKEQFNVHSVFDGAEGLKQAVSIKPDLIISDIMMPEMNGDMMLKEIRKISELNSIPIIMLTAKSDEELKLQLLKNGAQDYLMKPFTIAELKVRVENLIRPKLAADILQRELNIYSTNISLLAAEITKRKQIIEVSLVEKEVLLKEIHHRVKNNLQVISSLLNLQAEYVTDAHSLSVFKDSRDRIRSMALVHESLYKSKDLNQINFADYVKELVSYLIRAYTDNNNNINFRFECEDILLTVEEAVPLGLIANEIVTNAIKHAFPKNYSSDSKLVNISLKTENDIVKFNIKDNGIGFTLKPTDSDDNPLGLLLIKTLLGQIDGELVMSSEEGTSYTIMFKNK